MLVEPVAAEERPAVQPARDPLECPKRRGPVWVIALIEHKEVIQRILEHCLKEGSAVLFLTLHRYHKPRAEAQAVLDEHLAWNYRQQQAGRILFSGPVWDRRSTLGPGGQTPEQQRLAAALPEQDRAFVGVMVVRADSLAEAEALMREEPFVRHGYRTVEVYEWELHQALGAGPFTREGLQRAAAERSRLHGGG
ncbi:MAG: hypothetical protein A3G25_17980 [Betaproteobacteria bacterium RIFCSPLOWO2_12_FULL_63_13]|nr:MAG: hypothetical protein A3H32_12215 [Betaproteobacteria bacterium RIFCSPLOWO2_02_FULL_63_19]OGA45422.1 MAG: hypothetical protein A3G25_17980 [Betaproteobacteria bacterium RIFCSPLOWO2_12_FULL_63_13]